jgi:hypothetical protein
VYRKARSRGEIVILVFPTKKSRLIRTLEKSHTNEVANQKPVIMWFKSVGIERA